MNLIEKFKIGIDERHVHILSTIFLLILIFITSCLTPTNLEFLPIIVLMVVDLLSLVVGIILIAFRLQNKLVLRMNFFYSSCATTCALASILYFIYFIIGDFNVFSISSGAIGIINILIGGYIYRDIFGKIKVTNN